MENLIALINSPLNSEKLIRYSLLLANDYKLKLHLLYIQNPALFNFSAGAVASSSQPVYAHGEIDIAQMETDKENALHTIQNKTDKLAREISPDISVTCSAEIGTQDMAVNQYITDNMTDLVILESSDDSGFMFFDSSGIKLASKIDCPVLIIPPDTEYLQFTKIIYASDYNETDIKTLKKLVSLTGSFSPAITALHFMESGEFEEKTMEAGFMQMVTDEIGYDKIKIESIVDDDDNIGEKINEFAITNQANLIVLLKENRGFIEKLIKSSTTKKVLKNADLPILVYHEKIISG